MHNLKWMLFGAYRQSDYIETIALGDHTYVLTSRLNFKIDSVQTENYVVVWFQDEDKYSMVEIRSIVQKHPKEKEMVTVKGSGTTQWGCRALFIGQ